MYLFEDHFLTEGADAIGGRGGVSVRAHTHTDKAVFQRWRILLLIGVKLFALSGHAQKRHPKHRGGLREVDVNLLEWFAVTRPPLRLASALRARLGECNAQAWSTPSVTLKHHAPRRSAFTPTPDVWICYVWSYATKATYCSDQRVA